MDFDQSLHQQFHLVFAGQQLGITLAKKNNVFVAGKYLQTDYKNSTT
jgi:hypothetical protein